MKDKILNKYNDLFRALKSDYRAEQGEIVGSSFYDFLKMQKGNTDSMSVDLLNSIADFIRDAYRSETDWNLRNIYVKNILLLDLLTELSILDPVITEYASNVPSDYFSKLDKDSIKNIIENYPTEFSINASKDLKVIDIAKRYFSDSTINTLLAHLIQKFKEADPEDKKLYANEILNFNLKDDNKKVEFFDELMANKAYLPDIIQKAIKMKFFDTDQTKSLKKRE